MLIAFAQIVSLAAEKEGRRKEILIEFLASK